MKISSTEENNKNRQIVADGWNLGPLKASDDPEANKPFWTKFAEIMRVSEQEARSMLCANCEYYNNTKNMMLQMNKIPFDNFDMDGGGRGYCHEFDFICHNRRTCQAWESKDFWLKDEAVSYEAEVY